MAEMDTPEAGMSKLEALSHEIKTRKNEVGQHLQHPSVASSAESKLQSYRDRSPYLRAYNQTTERLLDNRKHATNGNGDTSQSPDWTPLSAALTSATDIRMESAVYSSRSSNPLERVTKLNRGLQARIKLLEEENERYRRDVNKLGMEVDGITDESATTDQKVANLMDDLQMEKSKHRKAQEDLEQKTKEVDQVREDLFAKDADLVRRTEHLDMKTQEVQEKDARIRVLEADSDGINRQNLELKAQIQEMSREMGARGGDDDGDGDLGLPRVDGEDSAVVLESALKKMKVGEEEWVEEKQRLERELERATAGMQLKDRQLEAVNARAQKSTQELLRVKKAARSGGFRSWLQGLWSFLLTLGWAGFLGFVYLLLAEDALRPRSVDVYRFAQ